MQKILSNNQKKMEKVLFKKLGQIIKPPKSNKLNLLIKRTIRKAQIKNKLQNKILKMQKF